MDLTRRDFAAGLTGVLGAPGVKGGVPGLVDHRSP
jgi:hypothetical protein